MSIKDFKKMMIEKHGRPVIFRFKLDESWDDYFREVVKKNNENKM